MEKYQFDPAVKSSLENSPVPFAVYQFIDRRVNTLILSKGFLDLFGFEDREEAYFVMDNDMYRSTHPDDMSRIADAAFRFATEGGEYNVVYRSRAENNGRVTVIHAQGRHVYTETGERLAYVWYAVEGDYEEEEGENEVTGRHTVPCRVGEHVERLTITVVDQYHARHRDAAEDIK